MNDYLETIGEGYEWLRALPWLMLALFSSPLIVLAWWKRVYPNIPLAIMLGAPCLLTFALLIWSDLFLLVALADVVVFLVALFDVWSLPTVRTFSVERKMMHIASLGMPHRVNLMLTNHSRRKFSTELRDDIPEEFEYSPEYFGLRVGPLSRTTVHYEFAAHRRGRFQLAQVHLRVRSLFGMWRRYLILPAKSDVSVYPDMKQLSEYAILARTNRLSLMGVRRTRKIGQDNEFERLRDYTRDDNYKHMDWRASARRNKLTVKDFQTSQSQRIIFMLDCGRMMTNEAAGLSLLDHSLNAMLMLSFVALRQGDSVGLICFSDQIHNYVPARGGMNQMNRLLHASFDRFPRLVESRYDEAFLYLSSHCKKRSLVVLVTNLIDEVNSHQVERYLSTLVGRHLPLGVMMRDRRLFEAADSAYRSDHQLYRAAAAAEILTWRHQVLTDLEHRGVMSLDVYPEDMTAPLVNRYLEIKARHLL